jgi:Tol biopolymer transport system component
MALEAGVRLGPYEVIAPLGAGGMGEVYRARDTRLGREVAVKVLPERVAKDPEALARFEREARTVAGLSDPHICSLHDVGTENDAQYAVFELLEGETLRERLSHGALAPSKAIELAMQMCQGLAAAHAKGIVHRDLKPENLFLTRKGLKILDFGLAKLQPVGRGASGEEGLSKEQTLEQLTGPGVAAGTVGYMSPEQARGEPADARSDIFATGVVLFEMLSGKRPFRRATHAETLTAILREDPPELTAPSGPVPPGLERITHRCLEKDPEDRFQSAHDLAFALEAVSGVSAPVQPKIPTRRRWLWAAALVAIAAIAGLWIGWPREPPPAPLRIKPITSTPGPEGDPALSPDGHQVAFVKPLEGTLALYIKLIDGGDPLLVSQGDMDSFGPAWSPDGRQIAFLRHVRNRDGDVVDGIFVVPALGGAERQLATARMRAGHGLAWSPDGKTLAIVDEESPEEPDGIFLLSLESAQRRRLTKPPAGYTGDRQPRFSPDGRTLAFIRRVAPGKDDFYLVPVEGGEERRLTVGSSPKFGLDWAADGRSIVFSSSRLGGGGVFSLWRVPVSGGDPELLEFGAHGVWPTVARRGGRLAYVKGEDKTDIWRVGGPSAPEDDRSPTRLISSTWPDFYPRYSPDGRQIAFVSKRSGAAEIWICDSDGSNPRQLTFLDGPGISTPSWSPDGEQIAFSSGWEGGPDVYVVSVSGGLPRRLTTGPSMEIPSSWSRDGRWVYFHSNQSGEFEVWKAPAEGGDALQVTTQGGTEAFESHDGQFLYFTKSLPGGVPPGIWRLPRDGGEEVQVLDRGRPLSWALLEQGILYLDDSSGPPALELLHCVTGQVSRVAVVEDFDAGLSASPDGRSVLYVRQVDEADIMLVENFQ